MRKYAYALILGITLVAAGLIIPAQAEPNLCLTNNPLHWDFCKVFGNPIATISPGSGPAAPAPDKSCNYSTAFSGPPGHGGLGLSFGTFGRR